MVPEHSVEEHHPERGVYVTTSRFTQAARDLVDAHQIELVDGDKLVAWLSRRTDHLDLSAEERTPSIDHRSAALQPLAASPCESMREACTTRRPDLAHGYCAIQSKPTSGP